MLEASAVGPPQRNHLAPVSDKAAASKQLSIATYNVENLAPTTRQQVRGAGQGRHHQSGDAGHRGAGGDPGQQRRHRRRHGLGQPGGNIRNVFLYDPSRVTFVDRGTASVNRTSTGTAVTGSKGAAALTLPPGRLDPTNPVWTSSREPLAGEFRFRGKPVIVIANHFDAKLGDQNADGRYQYPQQSSQVQRAGQALVVHDFVQQILATQKKADVVVVGDLNDYQFSSPLAVLRTGTSDGSGAPILTDLITTLPVNQPSTARRRATTTPRSSTSRRSGGRLVQDCRHGHDRVGAGAGLRADGRREGGRAGDDLPHRARARFPGAHTQ